MEIAGLQNAKMNEDFETEEYLITKHFPSLSIAYVLTGLFQRLLGPLNVLYSNLYLKKNISFKWHSVVLNSAPDDQG